MSRANAKPPELIIGHIFGRLAPQYVSGQASDRSRLYRCLCECGEEIDARGRDLRSGKTQSCGCLRDERVAAANERRSQANKTKVLRLEGVTLHRLDALSDKNKALGPSRSAYPDLLTYQWPAEVRA